MSLLNPNKLNTNLHNNSFLYEPTAPMPSDIVIDNKKVNVKMSSLKLPAGFTIKDYGRDL